MAYSPAATLARTACAISFGKVILNCCVERMVICRSMSRIKSYIIDNHSAQPRKLVLDGIGHMLVSYKHLPHLDAPQRRDWVTYS